MYLLIRFVEVKTNNNSEFDAHSVKTPYKHDIKESTPQSALTKMSPAIHDKYFHNSSQRLGSLVR